MKFAKTDVQANKQTLEVTGFKNEGHIGSSQVIDSLQAPTLKAPEDGLTPTSVKLTWNKINGATGYDIMIDGMVNSIPSGETVEFNVTDLPYNSDHTFQIRTRTDKGVSKWSDEISVKTLEDPWRNCPQPVNVDWKGGEQWGALKLAFDHDDKSGSNFHSSNGNEAIGMPMTIDYGKTMKLDKFVYTPRQDNGGNGNVAQMKVETSLDGVHWQDHGVQNWDNTGADKMKPKTVNLSGTSARYLRLTVQKSTGGFFSATELALYKQDGTEPQETGSLKAPATVGDEDYQHLGNCVGRENHGTGVTDWESHVAQSAADFNMNGAYDVYDMSFTMSKLDGGTKKGGKVAGSIAVVPEKTSVKQGETITVEVKVKDAKNVNAMGALVHYPVSDFEFVGKAPSVADSTKGMENRSGNYTYGDENDSVNIALANKGDKDLYSGTETIATFQLKAKKDCEVNLDAQAWLIGPKQDFVSSNGSDLGPEVKELGQADFKITMTNEKLPTDDGTNVKKLIQSNNYDGLFDNNESDNGFEFKWDIAGNQQDGKLPEYVMLPTTMRFELNEPRALRDVQIVNRDTYNGTVTSMKAVITYTDGTKSEFKDGEFAKKQAVYTLTAEKGKKVQSVEITPLTSEGTVTGYQGNAAKNRMLTLREINFNYVDGEQPEVPQVDKSKLQALYDSLKDKANAGYTEESWNAFHAALDEVSKVLANDKATQEQVDAAHDALSKADAGLAKPEVPAVDKSKLQAKYDEVKGLNADSYTADSWKPFADALAEAEKVLANDKATQDEVNAALDGLTKAADGLVANEAPQVDKSKLQALYDSLKDKANEGYTEESWNAFQSALNAAKETIDNPAATQQQIEEALAGLNAANEGLAKSEVPGGGSSNNGTGNNDGPGNGNTQQKPNGSKPGDSLVQTGDPALVAVGATGLIGSIAAAVGAALKRRRK